MRLRRKKQGESGQATVELAVMLVGLVAIILGVVFLSALCMNSNKALLLAKRDAEQAARLDGDQPLDNLREISTWSYGSFRYSATERSSIPFTAADSPRYSTVSAISPAESQFRTDGASRNEIYTYSWKSPVEFNTAWQSDFTDELGSAAFSAKLVRGRAGSRNLSFDDFIDGRRDQAKSAMRNAYLAWFGIRISEADIQDSRANQVYLPISGKGRQ